MSEILKHAKLKPYANVQYIIYRQVKLHKKINLNK